MAANTNHFPITIVSTDATALRELSWVLSSFGHQAVAYSDWNESTYWQYTNSPSLLLLDARDEKEIKTVLSSQRANSFVYRIVFQDANSLANSEHLMDSGVDDFIQFPFNSGEIINRINNGIRRLEFENKLSKAISLDQQTGMDNRTGFVRQFDRILNEGQAIEEGIVALIGVDFLDQISSQYGSFTAEEASNTLAQRLDAKSTDEQLIGVLQEGVYSVLLPNCTVEEGIKFAEGVVQEVNEQDTLISDKSKKLFASAVVLDWSSDSVANDVIERGLKAFRHAQCSGGNCVLDARVVEREYLNWKQTIDDSSSAQLILAQHVMEAFPLVLPISGCTSPDKDSLGIYAFASGQSLPYCIPVVDNKGALLGVLEPSSFQLHRSDVFNRLEDHLVPVSETVSSEKSVEEVAGILERTQEDYLVVVEGSKPVGYITSKNLSTPAIEGEDALPSRAQHGMSSLVVSI